MAAEKICPKCTGGMIEGFILDRSYGTNLQEVWVEGIPEKSFWSGIKTNHKLTFKVGAFRCGDCNFLEFYTTERIKV